MPIMHLCLVRVSWRRAQLGSRVSHQAISTSSPNNTVLAVHRWRQLQFYHSMLMLFSLSVFSPYIYVMHESLQSFLTLNHFVFNVLTNLISACASAAQCMSLIKSTTATCNCLPSMTSWVKCILYGCKHWLARRDHFDSSMVTQC